MPPPAIDVRRAQSRFQTDTTWLESRHSFSFAQHRDPTNTHHGLLLVSNDDIVAPRAGFQTHPHRDMEIITWVLQGRLEHKDSVGNTDIIYPGLAQRMSAGRGILHSEINPVDDDPVRFLQMWVVPDQDAIEPGYEQLDVAAELDRGELIAIASGADGGHRHDSAIRIQQKDATLWAARLRPLARVRLPRAPFGHLFVALGAVQIDSGNLLQRGDAARLTNADLDTVTAGTEGAEILYWEMHAELEHWGA